MSARLLVLNAGSSSLKFALFGAGEAPLRIASGQLSRIGSAPVLSLRLGAGDGHVEALGSRPIGLAAAAAMVFDALGARGLLEGVAAVGHRIVHGADAFAEPVPLDAPTLERLERLVPLAPLHQPANLELVRLAAARLPGVLQVGCFDTAFHAARPRLDRLYALPRALAAEGILAYGFHGLSYQHIASRLRSIDGPRAGGRAIVAHLGSGASLCAMDRGRSMATTMGFSALEGLVMATRCGAIDPGILLHLIEAHGMGAAEVADMLYHRSGLLGVSGISGDMQRLLESEAPEAAEAVALFVQRAARAIGALAAALAGLDTLVFTAGIGENSPEIRRRLCEASAWLGVVLDAEANQQGAPVISAPGSAVCVHVIPTDEELSIAHGAMACLGRARPGSPP